MRRIYHSAGFWDGKVVITGGERADGSHLGFQDPYIFDPDHGSFSQLATQNGPPDLVGHAAVILPNGTMVIVGGYSDSTTQMQAMNTIYTYDLHSNTWSSFTTEGDTTPETRRNFAAVMIGSDSLLVHGGTDSDLQTARANGFVLSLSTRQWTALPALEQTLGARWDHSAIGMGNLVFFLFGNN
jgi:N-acetylneuraminic acid mutarotase